MAKVTVKCLAAGLMLLGLAGCASTGDKAADVQSGVSTTTTSASNDVNGIKTSGLGEDSGFAKSKGVGGGKELQNAKAMQIGDQVYYFDFDKSDVHEADRASIDVQAKYLAAHPKAKVLLEGNTDPRGSREYNIALGERRANAVAALLKQQGVTASQIRIVSYGSEKLASEGHTEEAYQLDRRVNLVFEAK